VFIECEPWSYKEYEQLKMEAFKEAFHFPINNLCQAWSHFVENVVTEEYDVKKLKMTDRQTTDEKPWFLSRCDEIDS
jgi:hypothetical protein